MVGHGHRIEDVLHRYTLDQVYLYLRYAVMRHNRAIVEGAYSTRAAFGANEREWKKFVNTLEPKQPTDGKVVQLPAPKTKEDLKRIGRLLKYGK